MVTYRAQWHGWGLLREYIKTTSKHIKLDFKIFINVFEYDSLFLLYDDSMFLSYSIWLIDLTNLIDWLIDWLIDSFMTSSE